MDDVKEGWEQWFMLCSDRHFDSRKSDRELMKQHLDLARQRKAKIFEFGDTFDAMQGKYDPRRAYPEMDKRYLDMMQVKNIGYLDAIVQDAADFLKPYADLYAMIAKGNHETAILSHNDTDLINRLVGRLNTEAGVQINTGEYGGWIQFLFTISKTQRETLNLKYFHGSGGGGPVTKGVIQTNRQAVFLPDADIVINGHIHENWIVSLARERINKAGTIGRDLQHHVRTGTYKDDYEDGSGGWATEKGMPPKPKGIVWLRLYHERRHVRMQLIQDVC